uniref:BTB domain-containing protein n=1 Tax=Spumella elongata TaxID=89044 RepID=A0A7S3HNI9_9STRA
METEVWELEKERLSHIKSFESKIKLDVGGVKFTTSLTTLRRFPDTMIGAMFSGRHAFQLDDEGYYFIDRDGTHFRYILNFLRSPETFLCELTGPALNEFKNECDYYALNELMFPFKPVSATIQVDFP